MANNHIRNYALEMLRDLRVITIRKEYLPDRKALHPDVQLGDAVVRIDLRRLQGRMSEQFLYRPHVGAVVEQFGGEGVPEYVRTLFALNAALSQLALHFSLSFQLAIDDAGIFNWREISAIL